MLMYLWHIEPSANQALRRNYQKEKRRVAAFFVSLSTLLHSLMTVRNFAGLPPIASCACG